MTPRRFRRRAPIVLAGKAPRRRPDRERDAVLGGDALEAPVPGQLLVLLSRLHRVEPPQPGRDDAEA